MSAVLLLLLLLLPLPLSVHAEDLGELSANPYNPDSTSNPFGAGSPFKPDGVNNPFSPYGSPFSNQSAMNPYAPDAPRLFARLSGLSGFSGSSDGVSGPANKTDQIDQINDIDQFRLSVLTRLDQESLRRRKSLQPQQSHESLRPRPANRRKVIPPLGNSGRSPSSLLYSPL